MKRVQFFGACAFITLYVAVNLFVLARNAVGDAGAHEATYFFTWDMFPGHVTESTRKVALGRTAQGHYRQLIPNPWLQYRGGINLDLSRADMDRPGLRTRTLVQQALGLWSRHRPQETAEDPITQVILLDRYWPRKFNLPTGLYEHWADEPKPAEFHSWRVFGEYDVSGNATNTKS